MRLSAENHPAIVSPLVATCTTWAEARATLDLLSSKGVPRRALSVVAEGLRRAPGETRTVRDTAAVVCAVSVAALLGFAAGLAGDLLVLLPRACSAPSWVPSLAGRRRSGTGREDRSRSWPVGSTWSRACPTPPGRPRWWQRVAP